MSKSNIFIFNALRIVAWIIFVGLSIEAGGLIVNFVFAVFNPAFVPNLYQKLDLSEMYRHSKLVFYGMYSFILFISIMKAILFYLLVMLVTKLNLSNPFSSYVAGQITKISYFTLSIGLISYVAQQTAKNLMHHGFEIDLLDQFWADSEAFILMAAIIYVIATIFSRGVEIQAENDLTV